LLGNCELLVKVGSQFLGCGPDSTRWLTVLQRYTVTARLHHTHGSYPTCRFTRHSLVLPAVQLAGYKHHYYTTTYTVTTATGYRFTALTARLAVTYATTVLVNAPCSLHPTLRAWLLRVWLLRGFVTFGCCALRFGSGYYTTCLLPVLHTRGSHGHALNRAGSSSHNGFWFCETRYYTRF